jgi:hypothetical protein
MAQMHQENLAGGQSYANPFVYYGRDARLSLMTAIEIGLPGARTAYDYLMPQIADSLQAGFAIKLSH